MPPIREKNRKTKIMAVAEYYSSPKLKCGNPGYTFHMLELPDVAFKRIKRANDFQ